MDAKKRRIILKTIGKHALLLTAFCLVSGVSMKWMAMSRGGLLEDDSWFYAQIAYNWARQGIPTFDGVHTTSGIHVAWGGLLSGCAWLVSQVTDDRLVNASILCGVYLTVLWIVAERIGLRSGWSYLWTPTAFAILLLGALLMETAALALMLVLLLERLDQPEATNWSKRFSVVALSALALLCRIDALVILGACIVLERRRSFRILLLQGVALGVLLHLVSLWSLFLELSTVSSRIKVAAALAGDDDIFPDSNQIGIVVRALLLGLCWLAAAFGIWTSRTQERFVGTGMVLGVLAFSAGHAVTSELRSWYFLPGFAVSLWTLAHFRKSGRPSARLWRNLSWAAAVLSVALVGYKTMSAVSTAKERTKAWGFVDEMRRQIPSDDLVYQIDASGFTAYWSGKNVLNGDGLVNDSAYANRLLARQLDGYLEQNRVCWVVRTARVTPGDPKLLLDYRGLVVRKDEATRVFPEGRIRKSQTELWRMNRCNGTPPTLREVQVEESTF